MHEEFDSIRFGISGGIIGALFVLLVDIFIWVKLVPLYNSLMASVYGAGTLVTGTIIKMIIVSLILAFALGGILSWVFAFAYNKLPKFRIAG